MGKGCVYVLTNPCIRYTYREDGREAGFAALREADAAKES